MRIRNWRIKWVHCIFTRSHNKNYLINLGHFILRKMRVSSIRFFVWGMAASIVNLYMNLLLTCSLKGTEINYLVGMYYFLSRKPMILPWSTKSNVKDFCWTLETYNNNNKSIMGNLLQEICTVGPEIALVPLSSKLWTFLLLFFFQANLQ